MLFELENCLYLHEIPFFWDRRKNMIKYLKPKHVYNMCMQLSSIRENINRLLDTNNMQELARYLYTCMSN